MIIEVFSDFNGSMVLQGWGSVGMTRGGGRCLDLMVLGSVPTTAMQ